MIACSENYLVKNQGWFSGFMAKPSGKINKDYYA